MQIAVKHMRQITENAKKLQNHRNEIIKNKKETDIKSKQIFQRKTK